jgi:hypothetical protein
MGAPRLHLSVSRKSGGKGEVLGFPALAIGSAAGNGSSV